MLDIWNVRLTAAELETLACSWSYTDEAHVIRNVCEGDWSDACGLFLPTDKHKMTSYYVIIDMTKRHLCIWVFLCLACFLSLLTLLYGAYFPHWHARKSNTSPHKPRLASLTSYFVTLNSACLIFFLSAALFSLQLCLMHLFLFIYSAPQTRTCWYFVKPPMSHCMLTRSHFPTLLVSLSLAHTHTHTQSRAIWTAVLCTPHVY